MGSLYTSCLDTRELGDDCVLGMSWLVFGIAENVQKMHRTKEFWIGGLKSAFFRTACKPYRYCSSAVNCGYCRSVEIVVYKNVHTESDRHSDNLVGMDIHMEVDKLCCNSADCSSLLLKNSL